MLLTLTQIEGKVREFTTIINAPEEYIPTFGYSNQTGLPHIEIKEGYYTMLVCENGIEVSKEIMHDPDELLFRILHDITFSMACDRVYEYSNYKSFKGRLFQAQKNIISKINWNYMDKVKATQEELSKQLA